MKIIKSTSIPKSTTNGNGSNRPNGSSSNCQRELAEAWVAFQEYKNLLTPREALIQGSLFKDLIRPYYPH